MDRQRTQASQTARANAKKELMKDPNFLNEVRRGMQEDVQHTVEQGMQEQIASLNRRVATSEVSRILAGANLPQEEMQSYVEMFANEDIDGSIQRATTFVSTFNNSLQRVRDAQQQQAIENMPTPQTSATSVSEQQALQARLDEARKNTNFRSRDVMVASILREAGEKGIILK